MAGSALQLPWSHGCSYLFIDPWREEGDSCRPLPVTALVLS